jgi:hypothetical protein
LDCELLDIYPLVAREETEVPGIKVVAVVTSWFAAILLKRSDGVETVKNVTLLREPSLEVEW